MDTEQVIARFEAERQALAMMDHPHIARVLEAGTTESGRPFFVMELVKGVPITEYCDQNQLDARHRLQLFADTCSAIQHAHQKSVIHRDIKQLPADRSPRQSRAAFSADSRRLLLLANHYRRGGLVTLGDVASGEQLSAIPSPTVLHAAEFSPDGSRLVTAGENRTVHVWDAATGELSLSLEGHDAAVYDATFSADGAWIATASGDASARI